ncbi:adp-ribosylation factor 1 [Stylonychia lemnae]|uniref:Adp-ribosylation factor 1 n=1 Tax=Stylonychia lemnae TaxID=5949 RepID=A0A077ZMW8_STYLE|nr:adp-ribosylation factor 1 [Stylonychia lemnae]|eukprot:CDW71273.1 adp-ribosylation factor 1 [Stylonychia lemnae]
MFGLERAGKTHMLYNNLVGEGGMHTIKKLKETLGMNYEHVIESPQNFDVWDISGNPQLRKNWSLYIKNVPVAGVIYVVNVSEEIERLRESKKWLHMIMNEQALNDCIVAVVFNSKPNLQANQAQSGFTGKDSTMKKDQTLKSGYESQNMATAAMQKPVKKKDQWVESPFNQEQLEKIFALNKLKKTMIKQSFLIDVGEQKACEKVFQWVSARLDSKIKQKAKRERQQAAAAQSENTDASK